MRDAQEMRRVMYNLGENMNVRDVDECIRSYFDKDGDGFIGASDLKEAVRTAMGQELSDEEVDEMMAAASSE